VVSSYFQRFVVRLSPLQGQQEPFLGSACLGAPGFFQEEPPVLIADKNGIAPAAAI
jgi:hypothetical protein